MYFSCCAQLLFLPGYSYFVIVQGEKWHSRRKILTPSFHFKILEGFIQVFNVNSEFLIKDLEAQIEEPFVDINAHITKCTLDIICGKYQCSYCQVHFQYFTLILLGPVFKHQTDAMICLELFFFGFVHLNWNWFFLIILALVKKVPTISLLIIVSVTRKGLHIATQNGADTECVSYLCDWLAELRSHFVTCTQESAQIIMNGERFSKENMNDRSWPKWHVRPERFLNNQQLEQTIKPCCLQSVLCHDVWPSTQ